MASITVSVASTPLTGSKAFTFSDADIQRLINWAIDAYATAPTPAVPNPPALTPSQALVAWVTGFINGTTNNVLSHEAQKAAQALAAPAPIVAS